MAVLAGFVNRIFALPSKLSDVGFIPLSKEAGSFLESIGIYAFSSSLRSSRSGSSGRSSKNIPVLLGKGVKK